MYTKNNILISIITVVYNSVTTIQKTIESVLLNIPENCEYIIIDGGSTDGTIEIIRKFQNNLAFFISEKDNGIYDAMNKGISLGKGKFFYFINCGDILMNLPIKELNLQKDKDLVCFPINISNNIVRNPSCNFKLRIRNGLPHQGCFYKKNKDLLYNPTFKVFSDFDLNQRYFKSKKSIYIYYYPIVAYHGPGGISSNMIHSKEIFDVINKNFGPFYVAISFVYFKVRGLIYLFKK